MQIDTFFYKFGLTNNEKNIYLFLLGNGPVIASVIGKRANIKRVTVYASLDSLAKKGLVISFEKNKVNYFEAVHPEEILSICKEQTEEALNLQNEAKKVLSALKQVEKNRIAPIIEVGGKIKYYQGLDAVKKLIYETLEEGAKEQLCIGLNRYHTQHLWDEWKKYTKRRKSVGMNVRSIQPDTKAARAYKKRDENELRVTRLVPDKKFPTKCELNIIGDMIALFTSHGNEPSGAKIYNKDMAQVLRSLFELAWEKSKEYDEKITKGAKKSK
ncbi:hypothetical protein KJ742_05210 [Patescibacteria group bacterium]|nr:hypothetical protein [Patescibacteria group bacterium]MBU1683318.1 hypothetical protein [Patescibacteria group bacterium]MBU1934471.1 hypothetical protein [Patescibacteria group bacterium]